MNPIELEFETEIWTGKGLTEIGAKLVETGGEQLTPGQRVAFLLAYSIWKGDITVLISTRDLIRMECKYRNCDTGKSSRA